MGRAWPGVCHKLSHAYGRACRGLTTFEFSPADRLRAFFAFAAHSADFRPIAAK